MDFSFREKVRRAQEAADSFVCIGLDSSPDRLPPELVNRFTTPAAAVLEFNARIVDQTAGLVCAYKPNLAFYEVGGPYGLWAMQETIRYAHQVAPHAVIILDAKRGDIGSTATAYAKATFEVWGADAVTVNPYMGYDAVVPFLEYANQGKGVFVLGETSNLGAREFQFAWLLGHSDSRGDTPHLAEYVVQRVSKWGADGVVVGATIPEDHIRSLRGEGSDLIWLVPGIGAQGGDAGPVMRYGFTEDGIGPVVNSSRGIICNFRNRSDLGFAEAARVAAEELRNQLNELSDGGQ